MTLESLVFNTLRSLVADRVYRDIAPQTVTDLPRITFQQVGGSALNFLESDAPSKKNARVQVSCWGSDRDSVAVLSRAVEDAMRPIATVLAAPVAIGREEETDLYGSIQDFSVWHAE